MASDVKAEALEFAPFQARQVTDSRGTSRIEVTLGPATLLSPVGTPAIRAFVGLTPFSLTSTEVLILRDRFGGVFRVTPDRNAQTGEYVELIVEECISDGRQMPDDS